MHTYARLPVSFVRGEGALLYDDQSNSYLDAISGIAVCGLGHAHPAIQSAISEQAATLVHTSNLYQIPLQEKLGERLCKIANMDRVFFSNSGAEANEAALKLARLHGHQQNIKLPEIVVMENSFHGRTLATLSATGNRKVQAGFEPLVRGFVRAPFGDINALRTIANNRPNVVALLVEPIQGEGGIHIPPDSYLPDLRALCDEFEWLLMLDEIQTGMGRVGHWFAHQAYNLTPDVLTIAKALGNGVPIGACLARGPAAEVFTPGHHGSTFGGNPLACRAAETVIEIIESDQLINRAHLLGKRMLNALHQNLQGTPGVIDIRGRGLMIGIELDRPCAELMHEALNQQLLINVTAGNVIRLLPPLILGDSQADTLITAVSALIKNFLSRKAPRNAPA